MELVTDHKADPKGSLDSTLAFQSAIAAAAASSATRPAVYIPAGVYLIQDKVIIPSVEGGIRLVGEGPGRTKLVYSPKGPTSTGKVLVFDKPTTSGTFAYDNGIQGFSVGPRDNATVPNTKYAVVLESQVRFSMNNCYLTGYNSALKVQAGQAGCYYDSTFYCTGNRSGDAAVQLGSKAENQAFFGCQLSGDKDGLAIGSKSTTSLTCCVVEVNSRYGILLDAEGVVNVQSCSFFNNLGSAVFQVQYPPSTLIQPLRLSLQDCILRGPPGGVSSLIDLGQVAAIITNCDVYGARSTFGKFISGPTFKWQSGLGVRITLDVDPRLTSGGNFAKYFSGTPEFFEIVQRVPLV